MSTPARNADHGSHFVEGSRALLVLMGHRFLVTLLHEDREHLRVTFPVQDFPMEGMYVTIEFHDDLGYSSYETEVLQSPAQPGDGLLLKRPSESSRTHHRSSWRVAADFTVQLKSHVHPRRVEAPVINVSAGGMLVRTDMALSMDDNVDLEFNLPGDSLKKALAKVVHVHVPDLSKGELPLVGLQFVGIEPAMSKAITHYIWRRLRQLHPQQRMLLRRATDRI